jgi:hypothetical protein
MRTTAFCVRVSWEIGSHPPPYADLLRVIASGPGVPLTAAVLHRTPAGAPPSAGTGRADEHLLAEVDEASPWPQVADVLIVGGGLARRISVRAEFPGWLVAAFLGPDDEVFLAASRGWLARLVPLTDRTRTASEVWPYASFVHAWLVRGRSLDSLYGARLMVGPPEAERGVRVIVVEHSTVRPAAA